MKTQYTRVGGARVAYQVIGDGPVDLVFVPGLISHIELQWADPSYARFLRRLASSTRLIVFDPRGAGASDPATELPTLDHTVEDIHAVMDAADSNGAVILGFSSGGSVPKRSPGSSIPAAQPGCQRARCSPIATWSRTPSTS